MSVWMSGGSMEMPTSTAAKVRWGKGCHRGHLRCLIGETFRLYIQPATNEDTEAKIWEVTCPSSPAQLIHRGPQETVQARVKTHSSSLSPRMHTLTHACCQCYFIWKMPMPGHGVDEWAWEEGSVLLSPVIACGTEQPHPGNPQRSEKSPPGW